MRKIFVSAVLLAAVALPSWPQSALPAAGERGLLSENATVSLITILPGDALYSAFGHSAIRIEDPVNGVDLLFNYGQSEVPFDAAFVPRFLGGSMRFILGVSGTARAFAFYRNVEDRTILSQELNLGADGNRELYRLLTENALPQNRGYIYDFFADNCSTRIRDLLPEVLGDDFTLVLEGEEPHSYRDEIAPYLRAKPYLAAGIDLLLGPRTDRMLDGREMLFLPDRLMAAVAGATIRTGEAGTVPLSGPTVMLYGSSRSSQEKSSRAPLLPLWAVPVLAAALTFARGRFRRIRIVFDAVLFGSAGLVGSILLFLWLFSGYEVTAFNLNLFWAWPTHLAAAVLQLVRPPAGTREGRLRGLLRMYGIAAAAAAALFLVLHPLLPQNIPSAVVPLLLAIILRGVDPVLRGDRIDPRGQVRDHRDGRSLTRSKRTGA